MIAGLLLIIVFLSGCLEKTYIGNPTTWSDEQVLTYYQGIQPADIVYFAAKLKQDGYRWQSDGTNLIPFTDTIATPNFVLSHGGGNCNDLANLFQDFVKKTGAADEYIEYYLRSGYKWHLITVFKVGNDWFLQSDLSVAPIASPEAAVEVWYAKGYQYREAIQVWKKEAK